MVTLLVSKETRRFMLVLVAERGFMFSAMCLILKSWERFHSRHLSSLSRNVVVGLRRITFTMYFCIPKDGSHIYSIIETVSHCAMYCSTLSKSCERCLRCHLRRRRRNLRCQGSESGDYPMKPLAVSDPVCGVGVLVCIRGKRVVCIQRTLIPDVSTVSGVVGCDTPARALSA